MDFEEFKRRKINEDRSWGYRDQGAKLRDEYQRLRESGQLEDYAPSSSDNTPEYGGESSTYTSAPNLTVLLYAFSIFSIIGGLILAQDFWPEEPINGGELAPIAYLWPIVWISTAVVEAILFAAIASALSYLSRIELNTRK